MKVLLQAELLKLRTTRTFVSLVSVSLVLSLLLVVLTSLLGSDFTEDDVRGLFSGDFTPLFIMLLGVVGMAGEWRHRTITGAILAAPDRVRFTAAKVLAYAACGVVLSFLVTVTMMVVASVILSSRGETTLGLPDLLDVLWRNLTVAALLGAFGVVVGGLVRSPVVAIVGILVVSFALEPSLIGLVPEVGKFGPTTGAPSGIVDTGVFGDDDVKLLGPVAAVAVLLGWVAIGFAATAALLRRRDLV